MKNAILNLAAFLLLIPAFSSCKKEKTFKDQLVGNWKSVQVAIADQDVTSSFSFDLDLQSSYEFNLDVTTIVPLSNPVVQSYSGDWTDDEPKQDVTLKYSTGEEKTWEITSLTETAMTAEIVEPDNKRYKVVFERK
jgi:hypothetical protein